MSNVLDLVDQTIFRVERAAGVTNLCIVIDSSGSMASSIGRG